MSIWASISITNPDIPLVVAFGVDYQPEGEPTGHVDVAVARSFNDYVRVSVAEPEGAEAAVMLDRANAERLLEQLQTALRRRP